MSENNTSGQTKMRCNICGEVFECGYATTMHRKWCPTPIDWEGVVFTKAVDSSNTTKMEVEE